MSSWLLQPVAAARVAWLRTMVYLFVPVDVLVTTPWVARHDTAPPSLYRPLLLDRLLHLPAPTTLLVHLVEAALLVTPLAAATGRAPRLLGGAVAALYLEWMLIAMSWGKVDHDRFAFLVVLCVLPTAGRAGHTDRTPSEAAGFAVRVTGLAVVATYLLSVVAQGPFGGGLAQWLDSAPQASAFPAAQLVSCHGLLTFLGPLVDMSKVAARASALLGLEVFHEATNRLECSSMEQGVSRSFGFTSQQFLE